MVLKILLWKKLMSVTSTEKKEPYEESLTYVLGYFVSLVWFLGVFKFVLGFWLVGFCYLIIVLMMKLVYLFEQNLLSLYARHKKMFRT